MVEDGCDREAGQSLSEILIGVLATIKKEAGAMRRDATTNVVRFLWRSHCVSSKGLKNPPALITLNKL
jgi:hypothetical protein